MITKEHAEHYLNKIVYLQIKRKDRPLLIICGLLKLVNEDSLELAIEWVQESYNMIQGLCVRLDEITFIGYVDKIVCSPLG